MTRAIRPILAGTTSCWLLLSSWAVGQTPTPSPVRTDTAMTTRASGTFDVKLASLSPSDKGQEALLGRMSIDKQFHGDLTGASKGEMLSFLTEAKTSGVYVAVERVTATLAGRSGTFVLHHTGLSDKGAQQLAIAVVPESGTGDLAWITGTMKIIIKGGKHFYEFDYALPAK
jgi:Protein of unknown function (DUF3224)